MTLLSEIWASIQRLLPRRLSMGIQDLSLWLLTTVVSGFTSLLIIRKDGTLNRRAFNFGNKRVPAKKKAVDGIHSADITLDPSAGTWCRIFVPSAEVQQSGTLPAIVFFHGGGFSLFNPDTYGLDAFCREMAKSCRAVVVSSAYRLAPEHKHPTQYDDGFAALEWVRSQAHEAHEDFPAHTVDFSRLWVCGDSAGGNIAHHVAVRAGSAGISLAGLVLVMPFFGGEKRTASETRFANGQLLKLTQTDWMWRAFLPAGADRDHPCCNVCGPGAPAFRDLKLPGTLVLVGGRDLLVDRQLQYAEAMKAAEKPCKVVLFEKAFHGFYYFGRLAREWRLLHSEIAAFVRAGGAGADPSETVVHSGV